MYMQDLILQMQKTLIIKSAPRATGFGTAFTPFTVAQGLWGSNAQDTTFSAIGNVTYTLGGGEDYQAGVPHLVETVV